MGTGTCRSCRYVCELPLRMPIKVYVATLKGGISRSRGFEEKGLATHAVNTGTKCGHRCTYCSTGCVLRMHWTFGEAGESPYDTGYAIVDPDTPERVAADARRMRRRGLVQLSTLVDAWSPEAQRYDLGRRCLEAVLSEPGWQVRVLTKNAAVAKDFDVVGRHADRVLVGLSLTATPDKQNVLSVIEPNASPLADRMAAMKEARAQGLRTYAMLCPLLPGIGDAPGPIDELVRFAVECGAEEVFVEPVNGRGRGLILTRQALEDHGFHDEAEAVGAIRRQRNWSRYARRLVSSVQRGMRTFSEIERLRFLLYPSALRSEDAEAIRRYDAGVTWLT